MAGDPGIEDGYGDARIEPLVQGGAVASKRIEWGRSGPRATEYFVLVHEDDYQANDEEGDHDSVKEVVVAGDVQHWNLHVSKTAGISV